MPSWMSLSEEKSIKYYLVDIALTVKKYGYCLQKMKNLRHNTASGETRLVCLYIK
jgi:hypothetical protein